MLDQASLKTSDLPSSSESEPEYNPWRVIPITALTSIATIIGSGILALPVTLHHTGLAIFLALFTAAFLAMAACITAAVDLFQHACLPSEPSLETPLLRPSEINLNTLVNKFLPGNFTRLVFHIATPLSFLGLLISYGLAGPQALWQILFPPPNNPHPPVFFFFTYCLIGTIAVIFFINFLLPFFSSLTIIKGALFIAVVLIVAALPSSTHVTTFSSLLTTPTSFQSAVVPFLMGTVALGGMTNTMPVTFALLPSNPTKKQISHYRIAVLIGLTICYVLNIAWVFAIMMVVPREATASVPSLEYAFENGQISTVPLVETLSLQIAVNPLLISTVQLIVQMFILVSTAVSFFVVAAGCKNYMDGVSDSTHDYLNAISVPSNQTLVRAIAYILSFGTILITVVFNPDGFISVLTGVTSLALNIQGGLLIILMFAYCRAKLTSRHGAVPLPVSTAFASTIITYGGIVYLAACVLVIAGPWIGVHISAGE